MKYPWEHATRSSKAPQKEDPNPKLDAALRYAELGWHVFPCYSMIGDQCSCGDTERHSEGKHPLTSNGLKAATTDSAQIRAWWEKWPDANIGVRTGQISGILVVDVDVKPEEGVDGNEALEAFGTPPDTVEQLTGSGGRHLVFEYPLVSRYPEGFLRFASGGNTLGAGLDIRADDGYIIVEPSNHKSGKDYEWEASSGPLEGVPIASLPASMLDPLTERAERKGKETTYTTLPKVWRDLEDHEVIEFRSALAHIPSDDREEWLFVGMALHSTGGTQARALWDEWSGRSDKFQGHDQDRVWASFSEAPNGKTKAWIFHRAQQFGWVNPAKKTTILDPGLVASLSAIQPATLISMSAAPEPEPSTGAWESANGIPQYDDIPNHLLTVPGSLQMYVDWYNETAPAAQPNFAILSALAFGGNVCARRYRSGRNNYPTLWYLALSEMGSGKDWINQCLYDALEAIDASQECKQTGYTSESAVFTALLENPCHVNIIDEFAKYLSSAGAKGSAHERQAITQLMTCWGRPHGTVEGKTRSKLGMRSQDADRQTAPKVRKPAITIVGMSTPEALVKAIGVEGVTDGFASRFLFVRGNPGAHIDLTKSMEPTPPPDGVVRWAKAARESRLEGNIVDMVPKMAEVEPAPVVIPVSEGAIEVFQNFVLRSRAWMEGAQSDNLGGLFVRCPEIAMRISVIAAVSTNPFGPEITRNIALWATDFVAYHTSRAYWDIVVTLGETDFGALVDRVVAFIEGTGERGATAGDLRRRKQRPRGPLAEVDERMAELVMRRVVDINAATLADIKYQSGQTRRAWVATGETL